MIRWVAIETTLPGSLLSVNVGMEQAQALDN